MTFCLATANCDFEIRDRLLGTPVWLLEYTRAQRTQSGLIRFEKRGYKLIANVDLGYKCETRGGFMLEPCSDAKKFVQVDNVYQSVFGSYILTIRPSP
jgi:hypothetical protein